jgi:uncharacterized protein (DUF305 family)
MIRNLATHTCALVAGAALAIICISPLARVQPSLLSPDSSNADSGFTAALQAALLQMDAAMCITPSGDADSDFARAMIPHHQGAVEMARLELRYGQDVRLRRLAQGIVVEQSQEIALLRGILADGTVSSDFGSDY